MENLGSDILGKTIVHASKGFSEMCETDNQLDETLNSIWYYSEIVLNNDSNIQVLISTLIHELGHALKLEHPTNVSLPCIMQSAKENPGCTDYITNIDRGSLIKKWGEYNDEN